MPVIAICSGKGGVGKTTVAANLSVLLSKFGKTLVIDCDIALPNLHTFFGIEDPLVSLLDALRDMKYLEDAIYRIRAKNVGKLDIIPSSPSVKALEEISMDRLKDVIESLKHDYDFIVLDVAAGLSKYAMIPMLSSDKICIVINPDKASISDAHKVRKVADISDIAVRGIIVNRYKGEKKMVDHAEKAIGAETIGIIRESKLIAECWREGVPVTIRKPNSKVSKDFMMLAKKIIGSRVEIKPYGKLRYLLGW